MTRRMNKPLPHPYDSLFENGESSFEKNDTSHTKNISAASDEAAEAYDDKTASKTVQCGPPPVCFAAAVFIILEVLWKMDKCGQ